MSHFSFLGGGTTGEGVNREIGRKNLFDYLYPKLFS